jgi:hypothetical protein
VSQVDPASRHHQLCRVCLQALLPHLGRHTVTQEHRVCEHGVSEIEAAQEPPSVHAHCTVHTGVHITAVPANPAVASDGLCLLLACSQGSARRVASVAQGTQLQAATQPGELIESAPYTAVCLCAAGLGPG